jgi:hypothetical protein
MKQYKYQLVGTRNVVLSHIQTDSTQYQPLPAAPDVVHDDYDDETSGGGMRSYHGNSLVLVVALCDVALAVWNGSADVDDMLRCFRIPLLSFPLYIWIIWELPLSSQSHGVYLDCVMVVGCLDISQPGMESCPSPTKIVLYLSFFHIFSIFLIFQMYLSSMSKTYILGEGFR